MTSKTKKGIMVVAPVVIAGVVIYLINRNKNKNKNILPATESDVQDTPAPVSQPSPVFPLKQGSRGEKVKELQRIIGTSPDGIFGPGTENTLIQYAGIRIVRDQKELDALKNKANGITNAARSQELINRFNQGGVSMYIIKDATIEKVTIDAFGAIQYSGKYKTMTGGKTYTREDYILKTYARSSGNLIFEINKGTLAGMYEINPNLVSLK